MEINFDAKPITDALARVRSEIADARPLFTEIADYFIRATRQRFVYTTAPDGTRWRQKSPATLKAYARQGEGKWSKKPLQKTGILGSTIIGLSGPDYAEVGSNREYAGVMQFGAAQGAFGRTRRNGPIPWGAIPARPFLGISEDDERNIVALVDQHIFIALSDR